MEWDKSPQKKKKEKKKIKLEHAYPKRRVYFFSWFACTENDKVVHFFPLCLWASRLLSETTHTTGLVSIARCSVTYHFCSNRYCTNYQRGIYGDLALEATVWLSFPVFNKIEPVLLYWKEFKVSFSDISKINSKG